MIGVQWVEDSTRAKTIGSSEDPQNSHMHSGTGPQALVVIRISPNSFPRRLKFYVKF
jgi:hypothetical protein